MNNKVSVGVGSVANFIFKNPVARLVSLAGAFPKTEIVFDFSGKIIEIKKTNDLTPEGKLDYEFTIQDINGSKVVTRRSNVNFCTLISY